jgi:hypothetical protein
MLAMTPAFADGEGRLRDLTKSILITQMSPLPVFKFR